MYIDRTVLYDCLFLFVAWAELYTQGSCARLLEDNRVEKLHIFTAVLTTLAPWYPKKIVMRSSNSYNLESAHLTPTTSACSISKPGNSLQTDYSISSSQPLKPQGFWSPLHFNHSIHKLFHPLYPQYIENPLRIKFSAQGMIFR